MTDSTEFKQWTTEEVRAHFRDLLLNQMIPLKTLHAIDQQGTVWTFGKWYGAEHGFFATGFGHWSEMALQYDWQMTSNILPLTAWVNDRPATKEDKDWHEFYLTGHGDIGKINESDGEVE